VKKASRAGVAAVAVALALPGVASGQGPADDSLVGTGSVDTDGSFSWSFNVRSGPSGEDPRGELSIAIAPGGPAIASEAVDCLVVSGRTATVGGPVLPNPFGYTDYVVTVEDSGPSASTPDLMGFAITSGADTGCDPSHLVKLPLITGDIVVTDAPPSPTSTEQCKNGGWRTFGVFKNQGDCVSFVATGGKYPPA
jgi:hypothetical protein